MVTFSNGSANGSELCVNITIIDDTIEERNESFRVAIEVITPFVGIRNHQTDVIIIDNDG